jgi:hypothetical protein
MSRGARVLGQVDPDGSSLRPEEVKRHYSSLKWQGLYDDVSGSASGDVGRVNEQKETPSQPPLMLQTMAMGKVRKRKCFTDPYNCRRAQEAAKCLVIVGM